MKSQSFNILIIKTAALGDVLRTTVILSELRRKYPYSKIDWLTSDDARCIIERNPLIDRILVPTNQHSFHKQYDLVISLEEDNQILDVINRLKQKKITGLYKDENDGRIRYTKDSEAWFGMSLMRPEEEGGKLKADELKKQNNKTHPKILSEILGIDCEKTRPIFYIPEYETSWAKEYIRTNNIPLDSLVGLNPYAGQRWPSKEVPFRKIIEIVNFLTGRYNILLLGGRENCNRNEKVRSAAVQPERVFFIKQETSIPRLAAILSFCQLIITTDSLIVHLANALNKKTICIISHTSAKEIELYGNGVKLITKTPCHGSYKPLCNKNCMNTIPIREYADAIRELQGN